MARGLHPLWEKKGKAVSEAMSWQILQGDAIERLRDLDAESVQTCVTSPPYWGLRDYGDAGQLGLEPTPEQYVAKLVAVFREVRRVLREDGTVWLNLGDSYAASAKGGGGVGKGTLNCGPTHNANSTKRQFTDNQRFDLIASGLKPKDLCGIPWRVAFALQADGWWLRSDIIWAKPNPMPESVTDRPTRAHEYIFLLTKSARYFYDADAVKEGAISDHPSGNGYKRPESLSRQNADGSARGQEAGWADLGGSRNKRSVWTVTTQPYAEAHFATFPPKLIEPCILAGSPPKCCGKCGAPWERIIEAKASTQGRENWAGHEASKNGASRIGGFYDAERETLGWQPTCDHDDDSGRSVVLDPFAGSGTTGVVALRHDRSFVGIELSPAYCELARNRICDDAPLLNVPLEVAA